ncbi:E2 [Equus caballus papillomavirus 9]|uniref:Regulatory protein E2 n=1 Tax=Equus caballus papillomavirus 9 TaxID=2601244 RepID=A0A5B8K9L2_9PAPI|nr:E2 [Equus caballus papillomavirus 9]UXP87514.1 E2 protein [Equus caballus papillomavirus 9]UXP87521.1 E2 protein [Equus caballus papillomavirus 9]
MERLRKALDAVLEEQMLLYEGGSTCIFEQVKFWQTMRRENCLYHACRQKGLQRVGPLPIPSLAASAARARVAIGMELRLTSLAQSAFAEEPWTMTDTSHETFCAAPTETFKKEGSVVTVTFDGERGNDMWYTKWGRVYYQGLDDTWYVSRSYVDSQGLWYLREGQQHYYVKFAEDANRYGKHGTWEVKDGNETFYHPLVTSTTGDNTEGVPASVCGPCGSPDTPRSPQRRSHLGRRRLASSDCSPQQSKRYCSSQHRGGTPGLPPCEHDPPTPVSGSQGVPSPSPSTPCVQSPGSTAAASIPSLGSPLEPSDSSERSGPGLSPVGPGLPVKGAPFLVLSGKPNQLKCMRYRVRKAHSDLFVGISTTFFWTDTETAGRLGARMLVHFGTEEQCHRFRTTVPLPPGVTASVTLI